MAEISYPIHHERLTGFSHTGEDGYDVVETGPGRFSVYRGGRCEPGFTSLEAATSHAAACVVEDDEDAAPFAVGTKVTAAIAEVVRLKAVVVRRLTAKEVDTSAGYKYVVDLDETSGATGSIVVAATNLTQRSEHEVCEPSEELLGMLAEQPPGAPLAVSAWMARRLGETIVTASRTMDRYSAAGVADGVAYDLFTLADQVDPERLYDYVSS